MGTFYEFFAGGGMARAGLGSGWQCLFANDLDPKKGASYAANWEADCLKIGDVAAVTTSELPGTADLAWASFPCQDLSVAGGGAGLQGDRSGTFWPLCKLINRLKGEGRAPRIIVLENVCGALVSHSGRDFTAIAKSLEAAGYRYGALVINAHHFVPQSRPRLFVIGILPDAPLPGGLVASGPSFEWHPTVLVEAHNKLSARTRAGWIWWRLPVPPVRSLVFADLIEESPEGVVWHTRHQTEALLTMMSPCNALKVAAAKKACRRMVGTIYRRTRPDGFGRKVQRAEIRFDDLAGCLRTPAGGSSRQAIMIIEGSSVRSRLLSPREAARLMGLPDDYRLPDNYNEAYHLAGDGVVVPVVRFLAAQ